MGIRVGQGGVVGKGDENAVLIRRRELRVPSSVVTLFSMASSKNRSRNQACKRKKKKKIAHGMIYSLSLVSFSHFSRRRNRESARVNRCDQCYVELGTFINEMARSLPLFLDRS